MLKGLFNNLGALVIGGKGSRQHALVNIVSYVVILCLVLFLGKVLWNDVLVKLVVGVKPVNSIWELFGLQVLFSLLLCN